MPVTIHIHQSPGILAKPFSLILALVAVFYARRWLVLRQISPEFSVSRLVAFLSGVVIVEITTASPLSALDHQWLTVHMLKHLLLMQVAAPLILFGTTGLEELRTSRNSFGVYSSLVGARLWSLLTRPTQSTAFCWTVGTAAVVGWHIPQIFQIALASQVWHGIEDASFLVAGLVFWKPVMRLDSSAPNAPSWSPVLYLFVATVPCDILSASLCFSGRIVYPHNAAIGTTGVSSLRDQNWAGGFMWVFITFAYAIPALKITLRNLSVAGEHTEAGGSDSGCARDIVDPAGLASMHRFRGTSS